MPKSNYSRRRFSVLFTTLMITMILMIGCGGEERTVFRTGKITLENEPRGNFSLLLPAGWQMTEEFNPRFLLTGSITNGDAAMRFYSTEGTPLFGRLTWDNDDTETTTDIDGASVGTFGLPSDPSDPHSSRVARFSKYPGGPPDIEGLIWFETRDDRAIEYWDTFVEIAKSMRYEPPPTAKLPVIAPPDPSWVRRDLRTGVASTANFSVMMPPHWTISESRGIDVIIGTMKGDGIDLRYELGNDVVSPSQFAEGRHRVWPVAVLGETGYFYRPVDGLTGDDLVTGAHFERIPGNILGNQMRFIQFNAANLDRDHQETVLSILATIEDAELPARR